jgi:hypothetical protein
MREYKFRGKRLDTGEWVYGDLNMYENGVFISNWIGEAYQYEVDPETVGQYIGVYDKSDNNKEVYEGDILKDNKGKVYEIVWGHDLLWLAKTNEKQGNCYCPKGLVEHGAVVAGNRWDNPELLKEGSV